MLHGGSASFAGRRESYPARKMGPPRAAAGGTAGLRSEIAEAPADSRARRIGPDPEAVEYKREVVIDVPPAERPRRKNRSSRGAAGFSRRPVAFPAWTLSGGTCRDAHFDLRFLLLAGAGVLLAIHAAALLGPDPASRHIVDQHRADPAIQRHFRSRAPRVPSWQMASGESFPYCNGMPRRRFPGFPDHSMAAAREPRRVSGAESAQLIFLFVHRIARRAPGGRAGRPVRGRTGKVETTRAGGRRHVLLALPWPVVDRIVYRPANAVT